MRSSCRLIKIDFAAFHIVLAPGPFSLTIVTPSSLFSMLSKYSKALPVAAVLAEECLKA